MWWVWIGLAFAAPDPTLDTLDDVLQEASVQWSTYDDAPHYAAVTVTHGEEEQVSFGHGTLFDRVERTSRTLDVDVRVGTPEVDSTHGLRGRSQWYASRRRPTPVPAIGADLDQPLRRALWRELEAAWKAGRERLELVQGELSVRVEEEVPAADFEVRSPVQSEEVPDVQSGSLDALEPHLLEWSLHLSQLPFVTRDDVRLIRKTEWRDIVDTEGSRVREVREAIRLMVMVNGVADDGEDLSVFHAWDVRHVDQLPDMAEARKRVWKMGDELLDLLQAKRGDAWRGPILLSGRAAAVFTHEVMGHRVEADRLRDDDEGKTYLSMVGQKVMPEWISIVDDPTLESWDGVPLRGHYRFDDEGVPAQPAPIVEDGTFVGFLKGRRPVPGFPESNGHGRRSTGNWARARMGNTILSSTRTLTDAALRSRLVKLAKSQGRAFGYLIDDIEGGFTMTGRVMPNAFNVRATRVTRIYVDGRPDEVVRGLDVVGTPLVAFANIVAAGDTPEVFNGTCGAESGWVPVSAVAPALLIEELEVQLKEKGSQRPPVLAKPLPLREGTTEVVR